MATDHVPITLGVEEEFFLVDPESRDLIADPDPAIFEACAAARGPHNVVHEFLRSQIETSTRVCTSIADVRDALTETRSIVIDAAERHGARAMAASMHPFADWREQAPTAKERYERFAMTYQEAVRRLTVGGMHIHAGFGTPDSRIRVMTALRRHLPVLHALSGSSPFNGGRETGFKSYRLTVMGALPRTSLPPPLASQRDYDALVDGYRALDFIGDGSELWWDMRPSASYPTVELRICDICTAIEDAVAVAALYACLVRRLARLDADGTLPAEPATEIIAENRWLAARYGVLAFLGNVDGGGRVDIDDYVEALIDDLGEDALALDCEAELDRIRDVIREGTSADRQIDLYRLRRLEGDDEAAALRAVVDAIVAETRP
ncbi:MAG: carboxylate-amine ligase [Gammaproteobacteria bacterium]|nr:carboxylate-amine ligase [Gammaproteobacteria bacterium]